MQLKLRSIKQLLKLFDLTKSVNSMHFMFKNVTTSTTGIKFGKVPENVNVLSLAFASLGITATITFD